MSETWQLTDEEFEAKTADPSLIRTHEEAVAVLAELDEAIAHIQMQVDAYAVESNGREMPEDRQAWLRRASYACAMKRNHRHRVMQRDKEIRGTKGAATTARKDPAIGLAKQERLKIEANTRRIAKQAAHETALALVHIGRIFMLVAKDYLSPESYTAILAQAKKRRFGEQVAKAKSESVLENQLADINR